MTLELKPIETMYKGYHFRSRLEARWAVFFDALGIRWEYENQGYDLGLAGRYLPDFWLPDQSTWFEVKGQDPGDGSAEYQKIEVLCRLSGFNVFMGVGDPQNDVVVRWSRWSADRVSCYEIQLGYCPICRKLNGAESECCCSSVVQVLGNRIRNARSLARTARFEFGASIYVPRRPAGKGRIYLAGKVHDLFSWTDSDGIEIESQKNNDWRSELFPRIDYEDIGGRLSQDTGYVMGGPELSKDHGEYSHGLARECLDLVHRSQVVFAWITTTDTHGTFAELGAAHAEKIPIFVAFPTRDLWGELWFARSLAGAWAVAEKVGDAFNAFEEWWSVQA